jgi:hypothetical protein
VAAAGWAGALHGSQSRADVGHRNVLSLAKDGLMVAAVLTGVANGIQGARFARQAKDGAVPIESGTEPALETPQQAAGIQRRLDVLGNVNVGVGAALIAVNAVLAQVNYSRPTARRALLRRSNPAGGLLSGGNDRKAINPFTVGAIALAGLNEAARRSPLPTPTS